MMTTLFGQLEKLVAYVYTPVARSLADNTRANSGCACDDVYRCLRECEGAVRSGAPLVVARNPGNGTGDRVGATSFPQPMRPIFWGHAAAAGTGLSRLMTLMRKTNCSQRPEAAYQQRPDDAPLPGTRPLLSGH